MEFSRPEYWSGQPFPSPGDLPDRGIEPESPALQADSLPAEPQGKTTETLRAKVPACSAEEKQLKTFYERLSLPKKQSYVQKSGMNLPAPLLHKSNSS